MMRRLLAETKFAVLKVTFPLAVRVLAVVVDRRETFAANVAFEGMLFTKSLTWIFEVVGPLESTTTSSVFAATPVAAVSSVIFLVAIKLSSPLGIDA